jgi:hypothetical protein
MNEFLQMMIHWLHREVTALWMMPILQNNENDCNRCLQEKCRFEWGSASVFTREMAKN